jgi:RimJ/RimL family protein N-acetyltransferase
VVTALDLFPELSVQVDDVELRTMRWTDFPAYAEIVVGGLFAPQEHPTLGPWYSPEDLAGSARRAIASQLIGWSDIETERWALDLGVFRDGQLLGSQLIRSSSFLDNHQASTESLLAPRFRGRGLGTKSRAGALHLAFDVLGAETVTAAALADNLASHGVSRALGYYDEGQVVREYGGQRYTLQQWRIDRATWEQQRHRWALSATGTTGLRRILGVPV